MSSEKDKTVISDGPHTAVGPATQRIGHYEVVAELGRGGMGTVYRGYEPSLNRYVAIKVLAPHLADDVSLVGRFSREAKSVAALNHPNVVHIYYTGEHEGLPYFVMECIEGETLADLVRAQGSLTPRAAAGFLLQAAQGLAAAHDRGIIHRDVKPSNLMVDAAGTLKITDFGIALARDIGDKLTTTGQFVGTTGYVSPEVFQGRTVDSRSDIFSLGVVLFEMLAGVKPFDDDSPMGLMLKVVEKPAPDVCELNPTVDAPLQQILQRMIEKSPDERYQTCHELAADLKRYLAGEPLAAQASTAAPASAAPAPERSRRLWPVALVLLLIGAGASAYWWRAPLLALAGGETADSAPSLEVSDTEAPDIKAPDIEPPDTEASGVEAPGARQETTAGGDPSPIAADPAMPAPSQALFANEPGAAAPEDRLPVPVDEPGSGPQIPESAGPGATADIGTPKPLKASMSKSLTAAPVLAKATSPAAVPVADAPLSGAVIAVRGDPALAGAVDQLLNQAMRDEALTVIDPAFVAGAGDELQARQPDIARLRSGLMQAGGRYLVIATAEPTDAAPLDYFGQRDTLYTAQLELTGYDLVQGSLLGRWSEQVQYTNLNARDKAELAAAPMIRSLMERLAEP
ncbi:serine/threonine protein kinase [Gilvimarinus algae]|uniref:Protein kinase n=1 Tax=Gilvimarinus algae TaxID=3058037 RepID=A0ABT8TI68_9GAMM|nr:serine/threonine-protein kinase [Gilvimarinus sp. SDUM040014]MDO3383782.1 protein kinase [Gilvimarinus sp. SDUM040014]